jgi:hypothetical protein
MLTRFIYLHVVEEFAAECANCPTIRKEFGHLQQKIDEFVGPILFKGVGKNWGLCPKSFVSCLFHLVDVYPKPHSLTNQYFLVVFLFS